MRVPIAWLNVIGILGIHLLALGALLPELFSWSGLVLALGGLYVFGVLGINVGYHRLLTHRSFQCPLWLEHTLALLGVCCLQDTPAWWVAAHRKHHQHSDEEPDPHSPLVGFLWSHLGWLLVLAMSTSRQALYDRYARDIVRDPFYVILERNLLYAWIYALHAVLFFLGGLAAGWLTGDSLGRAALFGLTVLVWGVFVRTVLVWHITWSVNSVTHLWGYRCFETGENSRNNWLIGILAAGEGWHNNHHACQRSARHGVRWWELDISYLTIRLLERVGVAWDVIVPGRLLGDAADGAEPAAVPVE
jgi:stearoyl-CoA desaturase (delta-9 desaturase)